MSLWADYIKERLGHETIEYDWGFITFHVEQDKCFIEDYYVKPAERRSGRAWSLADKVSEIVVARGCNLLVGYVWPGANGSEVSLQGMIKYGFKLHSTEGGRIILTKELGG